MDQQQAERITSWFDDYVAGFYGDDGFVNAHLKLKEDHSRCVRTEMLYLADELRLGDSQKRIAEAIALLHDIGRFDQFVKHRTYNDAQSLNHCLLGLDVLCRAGVLDAVDAAERLLIEKAIECHGLMELPGDLADDELLFCRLIRDADKLDIFRVVVEYHRQYTDDPGGFILQLDFPDSPECSGDVVEAILNGRLVDYRTLRTLNDMKLMQLGWVYDINFAVSFKRIKQRRFLNTLLSFLPPTPQVNKVKDKILAYVDSRLAQQE